MLGLILQSLKASEKRVVGVALKKIAFLAVAYLFLACALAWATTAAYIHICQWLTPVQSGLLISFSALLLAVLCLFLASTRHRPKKPDSELVETLIAALRDNPVSEQNREGRRQGSSLPETALIAAVLGAIVYGKSRK